MLADRQRFKRQAKIDPLLEGKLKMRLNAVLPKGNILVKAPKNNALPVTRSPKAERFPRDPPLTLFLARAGAAGWLEVRRQGTCLAISAVCAFARLPSWQGELLCLCLWRAPGWEAAKIFRTPSGQPVLAGRSCHAAGCAGSFPLGAGSRHAGAATGVAEAPCQLEGCCA